MRMVPLVRATRVGIAGCAIYSTVGVWLGTWFIGILEITFTLFAGVFDIASRDEVPDSCRDIGEDREHCSFAQLIHDLRTEDIQGGLQCI